MRHCRPGGLKAMVEAVGRRGLCKGVRTGGRHVHGRPLSTMHRRRNATNPLPASRTFATQHPFCASTVPEMKPPRANRDDDGPPNKNRRPIGAGLSLEKFATAGVSKFDVRAKHEKLAKENLIRHSKYSKLKKKLAAKGMLPSEFRVKDSVRRSPRKSRPFCGDSAALCRALRRLPPR